MVQFFRKQLNRGNAFDKVVAFNEAHLYIEKDDLVSGLVEVVLKMRNKEISAMVASHDPLLVSVSLIEVSSQIVMPRFTSSPWFKRIQKGTWFFGALTSAQMSHLGNVKACVWSGMVSNDAFNRGVLKIKCCTRNTQHRGGTKTAVRR